MVYLCLGGLAPVSWLTSTTHRKYKSDPPNCLLVIVELGLFISTCHPPQSKSYMQKKRVIDQQIFCGVLTFSQLICIPIELLSHGCINYVNAVTRNEEQQPGRLCVDAAGLLEFPSFRLFNSTAFICINHARNRATGVSSTSVHSKNSGRCPRPTYGHI